MAYAKLNHRYDITNLITGSVYCVVGRSAAELAVQPRVGLLPERAIRPRCCSAAGPGPDGPCLTRQRVGCSAVQSKQGCIPIHLAMHPFFCHLRRKHGEVGPVGAEAKGKEEVFSPR